MESNNYWRAAGLKCVEVLDQRGREDFLQLLQRPLLDLADALLGHAETITQVLERRRFAGSAQAEVACQDFAFAIVQLLQTTGQSVGTVDRAAAAGGSGTDPRPGVAPALDSPAYAL